MSLLSVPKMLSARRSDQLLPTEKNKLMHGKWCNLTRAKSIHPERDPEPTNEQRSRPSPSPTIIHLSSVGLRSSASLWLPSFLSNSSERRGWGWGGGKKETPSPSSLSALLLCDPVLHPPYHHPSPNLLTPQPPAQSQQGCLVKIISAELNGNVWTGGKACSETGFIFASQSRRCRKIKIDQKKVFFFLKF